VRTAITYSKNPVGYNTKLAINPLNKLSALRVWGVIKPIKGGGIIKPIKGSVIKLVRG
jgi:hypothetical protein